MLFPLNIIPTDIKMLNIKDTKANSSVPVLNVIVKKVKAKYTIDNTVAQINFFNVFPF
tara:strand:- start:4812 stop:4985 length:174 start_codon:yes stop_codon:yes gene_type:complete